MNIRNFMLDIETLDTAKTAIVVSFAMVEFDRDEFKNIFFTALNTHEQLACGRTMSLDTIEWWMREAPGMYPAKDIFKNSGKGAIKSLVSWMDVKEKETVFIWAKPPSFDLAILENFAATYQMKGLLPWDFRAGRDVRTITDFLTEEDWNFIRDNPEKHNPVADCLHQIKQTQVALRKVKP